MKVQSVESYNKEQTLKWDKDYSKALKDGRDITCLPQLAYYVFMKNYGQVAHEGSTACWGLTKSEAINRFNKLTNKSAPNVAKKQNSEFMEWHKMFSDTLVPNTRKKYHAVVDEVMGLLVDLIDKTPKSVIQSYIDTGHWLNEYKCVSRLTTEDIYYHEQDVDDEMSIGIDEVQYTELMGLIEGIINFIHENEKRIFLVTEIIWDTNGVKITGLPNELTVVTAEVAGTDQEKEEYISNYLSDTYGFCHKGFALEPELYY